MTTEPQAAQPDRGHLLRVLGVTFGVAVVVGGVIGQGILRTPGVVAEGVQNPTIIIALWCVAGLVAWIDAMSTVELAASIRKTGGPYIFARRAFGSLTGLAVGVCDWLGNMGGIAFIAVVFGEYLHRLGVATSVPIGVLALLIVVVVGSVQWLGTKVGGRSQEIGSAVKAALFTVLIIGLFLAPRGAPVATEIAPATAAALTFGGIVMALRAISGTYYGWNSASYFCEEVVDPGRTIARATFSGIAVVTVIYVLANLAYLNVLTPAEMAGSNLVAADAAGRVFGDVAGPIVTAISLVSLVTIINAMVMVFPRVLFAMAREYQISALTRVAANGTPRLALIATVLAGGLLATIGVYETLLTFSTSLLALMSVLVNAAVIVLRVREPNLERPWKMPLYPLPAIIALTINTTLFVIFVVEDPLTAGKAFGMLAVLIGLAWLLVRRKRAAA
ncbi:MULTISPECIES: APC family permease [Brevundimonas]|uniref:Amino acid permease n=1 Tax=Brevundimonas nasdae TaxID=172043 RepID=A0ACD4VPV8_9CAUL|nr:MULTISPECIES: amino acid permease [Brevundimonas]WOB79314.1 amino acid permease [Brevundimonas nasdae]